MPRRASILFTVLLALVPTAPATGQVAGAGAGVVQIAIAEWLFIRGDVGVLYMAEAFRAVGGGLDAIDGPGAGAETVGLVVRAPCSVERGRHWMSITCSGRGFARELAPDQFQMDPLLSSATLRMSAAGYRHRVTWTGRGSRPDAGGGMEFGTVYVFGGAMLARPATARGRMFGRAVRPRGLFAFAFLGEGAVAGGGALLPEEPGPVRFERTFRLPARTPA